jgi:hypothetical protein
MSGDAFACHGQQERRVRLRALLALSACCVAALGVTGAAAQPSIPATFFGSVSIDGQPVPDGTQVRGFVDGKDCTQAPPGDNRGTVREGDAAAYVITVVHESQLEGCGAEGKTVTFKIGDRDATQTAPWKIGLQHLDLNAGSGKALPLPTASATSSAPTQTTDPTQAAATATEAAKFTPKPAGTLPTDDVTLNHTPGAALTVAATQGKDSGDSGVSPLLILLVAIVLIGLAGEAIAIAMRRRARKPPSGQP